MLDSRLLVPIFVVLTFIAIIDALQSYFIFFNGYRSAAAFLRFAVTNFYYCWYFVLIAFAVSMLSTRVSLERGSIGKWTLTHIATLLILLTVHQITALELDKLVLGFRKSQTIVAVLVNNPSVWGDIVVYVLFVLGFYMIEYRRRSQEHEIEYSRLEVEFINTRLQELRARMHPEFLFDALGMVKQLVHENMWREADATLTHLSEFMRTTVYDNERQVVTLRDELNFMNLYLAIENVRFRDSFVFRDKVDPELGDALVPNFILQPIVEELIRLNLDNSRRRYEIEFTAAIVDRNLVLTFKTAREGALPVLLDERSQNGISKMIRARLAQLYGDDRGFSLIRDEEGHCIAKIILPLKKSEEIVGPSGVERK